jgi:hypothetical protein
MAMLKVMVCWLYVLLLEYPFRVIAAKLATSAPPAKKQTSGAALLFARASFET